MKNKVKNSQLIPENGYPDTLHKYINKCQKAIRKILNSGGPAISESDVHKLRVEIKKQDVALRLLEFANPDFDRGKYIKKFRKIYKPAGILREYQIIMEMLQYSERDILMESLSPELKRNIRKSEKKLQKKIRNFKDRPQIHDRFFQSINKNTVQKFMTEARARVSEYCSNKDCSSVQLHDMRKWIKRTMYVANIFSMDSGQMEKYRSAAQHLGQWHDLLILLQFLDGVVTRDQIHGALRLALQDYRRLIDHQMSEIKLKIFEKLN